MANQVKPLTRKQIETAKARQLPVGTHEVWRDGYMVGRTDIHPLADTAIYWQDRCERATELLKNWDAPQTNEEVDALEAAIHAFLAEAQPEPTKEPQP